MKNTTVWSLVALICLATLQPVLAEEAKNKATPWKKYSVNLGAFFAATESSFRLGTPAAGVDVDVEDTLGLDKGNLAFRLDAFWRFTESKRHRFDFSWFRIDRDGSTTLVNDIEINGITFPAGTGVQSTFDFQIFKGAYDYSFFQDDRIDLAASVGLYVAPFSLSVGATGGGIPTQSESITAPLPVVGLRADFAITPKWYLKTNFDLFYLQVDGYTGFITDARAAVEYNAFKNIGFGLGFDALNVSVESVQDTSTPGVEFDGSIDFRYAGFLAYMKVYFD